LVGKRRLTILYRVFLHCNVMQHDATLHKFGSFRGTEG
jgi:hypothetical protein